MKETIPLKLKDQNLVFKATLLLNTRTKTETDKSVPQLQLPHLRLSQTTGGANRTGNGTDQYLFRLVRIYMYKLFSIDV